MARETGWKPFDFLALVKRTKNRQASPIVDTATNLLSKHSSKLGNDVWSVKEQLLVALLDQGENAKAEVILKELDLKFPDSQRVGRLKGLILEAEGKFTEATAHYKAMLDKNPANTLAQKRLVCVYKAQGKGLLAIKQLSGYLDSYQTDAEAWQELGMLYIQQGSFRDAAFCIEEVMLLVPHHFASPLLFAELMFTIGSVDNIVTARKYFSHSLVLNSSQNPRAVWGLHASSKRVQQDPKAKLTADEKDINDKLCTYADKSLKEMYEKKAPKDLAVLVKRMLEKK